MKGLVKGFVEIGDLVFSLSATNQSYYTGIVLKEDVEPDHGFPVTGRLSTHKFFTVCYCWRNHENILETFNLTLPEHSILARTRRFFERLEDSEDDHAFYNSRITIKKG